MENNLQISVFWKVTESEIILTTLIEIHQYVLNTLKIKMNKIHLII